MKTFSLLFLLVLSMPTFGASAAGRDFYQLKIYHLKDQQQEKQLDEYLEKAYLPALHRAGIPQVGVFKPRPGTEGEEMLVYVFIPFRSYKQFASLEGKLEKDREYLESGKAYIEAPHKPAPYDRIETILLVAFEGQPRFQLPDLNSPRAERVYELRSYEGPTEALYRNKVDMFNKGDEINIFKRLGFNAVFYGEVIAGSRMPNLMYLTTFANQQSRDEHWKAFGSDPAWKKLSSDPEYPSHNVSRNQQIFLYPTEYSDI